MPGNIVPASSWHSYAGKHGIYALIYNPHDSDYVWIMVKVFLPVSSHPASVGDSQRVKKKIMYNICITFYWLSSVGFISLMYLKTLYVIDWICNVLKNLKIAGVIQFFFSWHLRPYIYKYCSTQVKKECWHT